MVRDDAQLSSAKRAYQQASMVGNRQEEARWANMIGDILKHRGEYVVALKWLRIDYEISVKYLPEKQLLPTCQSLGEVYLRLQEFKEALIYQKKHLELARDADDLVEQQRASTQLGRTYHEMFLKSEDDHSSVQNAKKYFKSAMKLARTLKESRSSNKSSSFLKEFIDAHNNLGMLEMELDNFEGAEKILLDGLGICDEEEVKEDEDGRSRLHHNLGCVYMEMRKWKEALYHIKRDINICKNIGHRQGEAKGYINLGELHYRGQMHEDAIGCYQKAHDIAKVMEDEDALVDTINQNLETAKEAVKVKADLKKEKQKLLKLERTTVSARGTPRERKCLLEQNSSLDRLIEKSSMILAWRKHLEFAKMKKKVASELCDKEKLSDSFLVIGESYQKLRNFNKAHKWYTKSWNTYRSIGNLEGQALAKINIGGVLDSVGDWTGALEAFEEGRRIAVEAKMPSIEISALENMHYSHMIRFDNVEEARTLQLKIRDMKSSINTEHELQNMVKECCSETETEEEDDRSDTCNSKMSGSISASSKPCSSFEELNDDLSLISFLRSDKKLSKPKIFRAQELSISTKPTETSLKSPSKSADQQQPSVGRKRPRVVLSDDESDGQDEVECLSDQGKLHKSPLEHVATSGQDEVECLSDQGKLHKSPLEHVATSDDVRKSHGPSSFASGFQSGPQKISKHILCPYTPTTLDESTCSYKSVSPKVPTENCMDFGTLSAGEVAKASNFAASGSKMDDDHVSGNLLENQNHAGSSLHIDDNEFCRSISFKIDDKIIHVDAWPCMVGDKLSIDCMKAEVACLYYLQLSQEKRSKGLLPIIQHMKCGGRVLESSEAVATLKNCISGNSWIEITINGWVQKRLMKSYLDNCKKLSEAPNMKLLKKLYNMEFSEDEVSVSGCELQDISVTPLLSALHEHKAIAMLDLSHNSLGNGTMEKLQEIFISSSQKYGGLTLDLHCNRFGPTVLFQICECPVLFARLEVLNVSGNRLTDACGAYLTTILQSCKALYSLNIEHCSITSRTIQKITEAMGSGSALTQLYLGHNNPISGNAIVNLLAKLSKLNRFSELNLNGIKLSKFVVDGLCQLLKTSCLSGLMLGGTNIGADAILELSKALSSGPQELVKLDLSFCGLTSHYSARLCSDISLICGILDLNLGGNSIGQEGVSVLASLLMNPQCSLKTLVLNKCHLGLVEIIKIIQALSENQSLEELNLEENVDMEDKSLGSDLITQVTSKSLNPELKLSDMNPKRCSNEEVETVQQGFGVASSECNLEVADSEDDLIQGVPVLSVGLDDNCRSSCQRNATFEGNQFIQELSTSISMARWLQLLILSKNGFTAEIAEALYTSWSSSSRQGSAEKHIKDQIIHFSIEGKRCCGVKICCRRD